MQSMERRLEVCRRWLNSSLYWRAFLYIGGVALSIYLVVATGLYLYEQPKGLPTREALRHWPATIAIVGFASWVCLLAWVDRLILLAIKKPLRETRTSRLIELAQEWTRFGFEAVGHELVVRAEHRDRRAANYLYERTDRGLPDLTGEDISRRATAASIFGDLRRTSVMVMNGEGRLVRLRDRHAKFVRNLRYLAVASVPISGILRDFKRDFPVGPWSTILGTAALMIGIIGPGLWNLAMFRSELEKVSVHQLLFLHIRCPGRFRKAAEKELRRRGLEDPAARNACLRTGIFSRDPRAVAGFRETI